MTHLRDKGWYFQAYVFSFLAYTPGFALVIVINNGIIPLLIFLCVSVLIIYFYRSEIKITLGFTGLVNIFLFKSLGFLFIASLAEYFRSNDDAFLAIGLFIMLPFLGIMILIKNKHQDNELLEKKLSSNKSLKNESTEIDTP